jgi:hypothetical protein
MESTKNDEQRERFLRENFSASNLAVNAQFIPIKEYFNSVYHSERPNYLVICKPNEVEEIRKALGFGRGYTPFVFDDLRADKPFDVQVNELMFFIGSYDHGFRPFLMISTEYSRIFFSYIRRMNMTILSTYDIDVQDYLVDKSDIKALGTQPIGVYSSSGNLERDIAITHVPEQFFDHIRDLERISGYTAHEFPVSGIDLPPTPFPVFNLNMHKYALSVAELENQLITSGRYTYRFRDSNRRHLLVAPTGSGKTTYVRLSEHDLFVDLDSIFEWPKGDAPWWEDPDTAEAVNRRNGDILEQWLNAKLDGRIGFYADDFNGRFKASAYVLIPEADHARNLRNARPGQPGIEGLSGARSVNYPGPVFSNFSQAVGHIYSNGRVQIPRRNRWSNRLVFVAPKSDFTSYAIQHFESTQTMNVKSLTYSVSRLLNLGIGDMEIPRRCALMDAGGIPFISDKISGVVKWKGKPIYVDVAGHTVNYMLLSAWKPMDWSRVLDQIEWNFELYSTRRRLTVREKQMLRFNEFAETIDKDTIYSMWHNPIEYILGVNAGIVFLKYLRIPLPDLSWIRMIYSRMVTWIDKFPKAISVNRTTKAQIELGLVPPFSSVPGLSALPDWSPRLVL